MLCRNCSSVRFQRFEEIDEAVVYAQNPSNSVFQQCIKYQVSSVECKYYIHQPDFQHLASSKERGCYFCAALWFAFNEQSVSCPEQDAIDSVTAGDTPSTLAPQVSGGDDQEALKASKKCPVVWSTIESRQPEFASEVEVDQQDSIDVYCGSFQRVLFRVETPEGPFARITHRVYDLWDSKKQIDGSTQSVATFELANLWFNRCLSSHPTCSTVVPILPKRVIDVQSACIEPVLYEPASGETGEYICLSHCWGETKPLQMERQTGPENGSVPGHANIYRLPPLLKWPKTFQDAVDIARKLGIRYLWIDNTSIKQNDKEDWATESLRMAEYFGNATLTLAAGWAPNDDLGIYHTQNPLLTYPLCLIEASNVPLYKGYYVSLHGLDYVNVHEVDNEPLSSRAWVLQEQQLSRRILRYGSRGIYWMCFCSTYATPGNIMGLEQSRYQHPGVGANNQLTLHIRRTISTGSRRNPYLDIWYGTVEEFTSRSMKMKSDVLPALSGLAQALSGHMDPGDRYVAGLWQSDLMFGLLWTADVKGTRHVSVTPGTTNYDPVDFSGPSWSWISQCHKRIHLSSQSSILPRGRCDCRENTAFVGTEITGVEIQYKPSSEPYGQVRGGRLFIKTKLLTLRIDATPYTPTAQERMWPRSEITSITAKNDVHFFTVDMSLFSRIALVNIEGTEGRELSGDCAIDDKDSELWSSYVRQGEVEAAFLPLIMYRVKPEGLRTAGLVLLPTGKKGDEFVRIGRAEIDLPNQITLQRSTLHTSEITVV